MPVDGALASLVDGASRVSLAPGETLAREGDVGDDVFVVLDGRIDVVRGTGEEQVVVAHLDAGSLAGEVAHAMGGGRIASLVAADSSTVAVVGRGDYLSFLDGHPETAAEIAAAARLRRNRTRATIGLIDFFGADHRDLVDEIIDSLEWVTYGPGEVVFRQGERSTAAFLLVAGRVHIHAVGDDEETVLDLEIGRGELLGEIGILDDRPRTATARATRDTTLARLSAQAVGRLDAEHPGLLTSVSKRIVDRLLRRHQPDHRARVVAVLIASDTLTDPVPDLAAELGRYGTTLTIDDEVLRRHVRDVDGPGGTDRVAEFIHEADVGNDYVLLVARPASDDWAHAVAQQCDRFVAFASADPDAEEIERIRRAIDALTDPVRSSAWAVRVHPSATPLPSGTAQMLDRFRVAEVHNVRAGHAPDLERVARLATGNGRGLVLSGGGAKGMAHVGAAAALRHAGIEYDRIGGASMGALMAALLARDLGIAATTSIVASEFHRKLFDITVPLVSLTKGERVAESVRRLFSGQDVLDTWIPIYAVSTNLTQAELTVHRRGSMVRALKATIALPVIMPPVPIGGDLHVDGGVLDNLPISAMDSDPSIGVLVAVDVSPPSGPPAEEDYGLSVSGWSVLRRRLLRRPSPHPDIGQTLMSSMLIGSSRAQRHAEASVDLLLDLDLDGVGLLEYDEHDVVIERGRTGATPLIEAWLDERVDPV